MCLHRLTRDEALVPIRRCRPGGAIRLPPNGAAKSRLGGWVNGRLAGCSGVDAGAPKWAIATGLGTTALVLALARTGRRQWRPSTRPVQAGSAQRLTIAIALRR